MDPRCMQVLLQAREEHWILWLWSYRHCELPDVGSGH